VQLWSSRLDEKKLAAVVTAPPWRFGNSFSASPPGPRGPRKPGEHRLENFCYSQHHGLLLPATSSEGRVLLAAEPITPDQKGAAEPKARP
jgi:hypothetical protein